MKKKDLKYILVMCILILVLVLSFLLSNKVFGSQIDWISQHTIFPDYFRKLFYKTGNLFPNFSLNLGAGQNIFYFSYYGLFNPIYLISYFLPFISMQNYIIVVSILSILIAMILLYYFLKDKVGENISFFCSILYLLAGPIIFHAHKHIMFTNYMPFLIMGLIGIDKYNKDNKKILLILSTLLMILTSYYYSISGIIVLLIYSIYLYLSNNKFEFKTFIKKEFNIIIPIFIGILLSSFFLLPTAYTLLSGRILDESNLNVLDLFIPSFNIENFLYSNYSIGLTSILVFTLIYFILNKKKENKFLGIIISLLCFIPFGVYILNGTLYARFKVLIAFIPLVLYMIGLFIKNLNKETINKKYLIILGLFIIITLPFNITKSIYIIDILLMLLFIFIYLKNNKKLFICIPVLVISILNFYIYNNTEKYVLKDYNTTNINYLVNKIDNKDFNRISIQNDTLFNINKIYNYNHLSTSIYSSTSNSNYYDFYNKIFDNSLSYKNKLILNTTKNILFEKLMSEKYIIRKCNDSLLGYKLLEKYNNYCLYENKNVNTLGYGTNIIFSEKQFNNLEYPYNIELLLNGIVVDNNLNNPIESKIYEEKLAGKYTKNNDITYVKDNDIYKLNVQKETKVTYTLNEELNNKILIIDFDLLHNQTCDNGDQAITINGIRNKLTCTEKGYEYENHNNHMTYVIAYKNLNKLVYTFTKGTYEIANFKTHILDYEDYININSKYKFNIIKYNDNQIEGNINMEEDGYFTLTIPYDKGFTIKVDDQKVAYEKVNIDFIGFKLNKGYHNIKITYNAPLFKEGIIISSSTLLLSLSYILIKKYKYSKNNID